MAHLADLPGPDVRTRLETERNVWLSTVRPDGSTHVTPVWFVYADAKWWIGADHRSVKVRNVRAEPRVSLALEDGRFPVVAEGDVSLIHDGFPAEVVTAFKEKYEWDLTTSARPGGRSVLLEIRVRRWLLAGTAR
ncbi:pyridoxamine 5'-phosphate oxidase family protein [Streptomyces sp. NPDC087862]|uniref:pyridoxamine 5'-phosphate oxidase family protein n=1 Tax=Streptomyces sp. NPDC087862 TaxID=3365813 RepID=UPI0037FADF60